jgi:hypothetical protein
MCPPITPNDTKTDTINIVIASRELEIRICVFEAVEGDCVGVVVPFVGVGAGSAPAGEVATTEAVFQLMG